MTRTWEVWLWSRFLDKAQTKALYVGRPIRKKGSKSVEGAWRIDLVIERRIFEVWRWSWGSIGYEPKRSHAGAATTIPCWPRRSSCSGRWSVGSWRCHWSAGAGCGDSDGHSPWWSSRSRWAGNYGWGEWDSKRGEFFCWQGEEAVWDDSWDDTWQC